MALPTNRVALRLAFNQAFTTPALHRAIPSRVSRAPLIARPTNYAQRSLTPHLGYRNASLHTYRIYSSLQPAANLSIPFDRVLRFDKVPTKLPDWWDEEEDEEDENDKKKKKTVDIDKGGIGKSGGSGGSGGGGGGHNEGGSSGSGGDGGEKGFFAALLAVYIRSIKTQPVRTKAISTCILALLGDYCAQRIAQQDRTEFVLDVRRSASIGLWAFCFMGPVLHYWYGFLDRVIKGRYAVWGKVFSDQVFFAPFFNGAFIAGVGSLEGNHAADVVDTVRAKLWPTMKANWTLWPAAQFVNFAIIPRTFQIVYVNCVALVWNVILTYISHDDKTK